MRFFAPFTFILILIASVPAQSTFDILIKNGTVYDGAGGRPRRADVGIRGDRIVAVGDLGKGRAATVVDAQGLAVAPGFINMLSWAVDDLIVDGRSLGDIKQGVTLEIFGEGDSMGPLNDEMKRRRKAAQGDLRFEIEWTTLAEYLQFLEKRGVSCNVASYIGATTIREYVIGLEDRKATPEQMQQMRELVRKEMEAGALGIGSSVAYIASKGAVNSMTLYFARALAPHVRVNAVCPGMITTRWFVDGIGQEGYEKVKAAYEGGVPLQRASSAEDVAEAVLWLVEGARSVTGELLLLDGGMHLAR